jgi:hypothetical protein
MDVCRVVGFSGVLEKELGRAEVRVGGGGVRSEEEGEEITVVSPDNTPSSSFRKCTPADAQ